MSDERDFLAIMYIFEGTVNNKVGSIFRRSLHDSELEKSQILDIVVLINIEQLTSACTFGLRRVL